MTVDPLFLRLIADIYHIEQSVINYRLVRISVHVQGKPHWLVVKTRKSTQILTRGTKYNNLE